MSSKARERVINQRDIANRLGLSASTVSLALRDDPQISFETRQLVRNLAVEMGYALPKEAQPLPIRQILFITIYSLVDTFFARILSGAERECRLHGMVLRYCQVETLNDLQLPGFRNSDAFLIAGQMPDAIIQDLVDRNQPVVLIEQNTTQFQIDRVMLENFAAEYRLVRQLYAWGHRKIVYIDGPHHTTSFRERRWGYEIAMRELGLEIITLTCSSALSKNSEQTVTEWLASARCPRPTAFIACNDNLAVGALHALQQAGLQVPEDVSVVGFDDDSIATSVRPALTTWRVPCEHLGTLAVRRLIARASNLQERNISILVEPELIVRDSTRLLV